MIGGMQETQEMLDYCGEHNIVSDVEVIRIDQVNRAFERLLKQDVKYRLVIDMSSLVWYIWTDFQPARPVLFSSG
jgi:alcohol dehydrogenase (NADP+)